MHRTCPFLLATALLASACARGGAVPAEPELPRGAVSQGSGAASGDTLRVPYGGSAVHAPSGVRVTFHTLVSDSRCPIDAVCVWEGDAVVRLRLERAGAASDTALHWSTRPGLGPRTVTVGGWDVTFFGLTPAPQASAPAPGDAARTVWLLVRRSGG